MGWIGGTDGMGGMDTKDGVDAVKICAAGLHVARFGPFRSFAHSLGGVSCGLEVPLCVKCAELSNFC